MRKTKFIVVCSNLKIRCDEDELIQVYEAISSGSVRILRQGIFNPSFFAGVCEDTETMAEFREKEKYEIRDGKIKEYPKYPDLFFDLRQEIKKLSDKKSYVGIDYATGKDKTFKRISNKQLP